MRRRAIRHTISVPGRGSVVRVYALADIHLGSALCDEALLQETVRQIARDPLAYWVGLGDMCEWINRRDPRHRESRLAEWLWGKDDLAAAQRARLLEVLAPIRGKCLALVKGNHEDAILQHAETDVYYSVVEAMRVEGQELALGASGFVTLTIQRQSFRDCRDVRFFLHHGYVGGRLAGAKALELERLPGRYDADVILLGHSHVKQALTVVTHAVNAAGEVVERRRVCAVCGTFLRTHGEPEGYAELRGYPPTDVGPVVIEITAFRGEAGGVRLRAVV